MDLFLARKGPQELVTTLLILDYNRIRNTIEYIRYICPPNVSSDQNKRRTNNPFEKAAKLEEICDLMQNPSPIGWQRAVDLNIIDFCEWDNAKEQETDLPRFIHANFELIS